MLKKFKIWLVNYFIRREIKRSNYQKVSTNLERARSVVIIFALDDETLYEQVIQLIEDLTLKKKNVSALAYSPSQKAPYYFAPRLKIDVFTQRNLNFFGIPSKGFIRDFINNKCDLLIDLTTTDYLPVDYITSVSHAGFKAGRHRTSIEKYYDFMVLKSDDLSNSFFLSYLLDYLTKINTSS